MFWFSYFVLDFQVLGNVEHNCFFKFWLSDMLEIQILPKFYVLACCKFDFRKIGDLINIL
ncbi:hypothetical protein B296_00034943 [Ensete ventricosum]|uniref:Uncharacterized protein n=1 Tax=Ensete ventricosum TaxID=4639 RepID=A0A426YR53_ENSVE|nr:hypothetical protein B296_00034943 [Ensete ventricosum]